MHSKRHSQCAIAEAKLPQVNQQLGSSRPHLLQTLSLISVRVCSRYRRARLDAVPALLVKLDHSRVHAAIRTCLKVELEKRLILAGFDHKLVSILDRSHFQQVELSAEFGCWLKKLINVVECVLQCFSSHARGHVTGLPV